MSQLDELFKARRELVKSAKAKLTEIINSKVEELRPVYKAPVNMRAYKMFPIVSVQHRVQIEGSLGTRVVTLGTFRYTKQGIGQALAKIFATVAASGDTKVSPARAWMQLEDETGTYIFDVYDADYIDVTKTAVEHSKARRRLAAEVAKEKREGEEAFMAAVNGEPIPIIRRRDGKIAEHVKREYANGKKLAADIGTIGN